MRRRRHHANEEELTCSMTLGERTKMADAFRREVDLLRMLKHDDVATRIEDLVDELECKS